MLGLRSRLHYDSVKCIALKTVFVRFIKVKLLLLFLSSNKGSTVPLSLKYVCEPRSVPHHDSQCLAMSKRRNLKGVKEGVKVPLSVGV